MGTDTSGQGRTPADDGWIQCLLEQYEKPLMRYAAQLLGGDVDLARDAVQDTFLRLCREPRAEIEPHAAAWLYTVCRNRVFDMKRKESRVVAFAEGEELEHPGSEPSPAHAVEQRDSLSRINAVLSRLPDNQREVVRLKFQGGLSYKEISEVTRLSVTNVGFLLHTALKSVRATLKNEFGLIPVADSADLNRRNSL
jgi:RNA polymerase sigma factor (sigma-70 family)